MDSGILTCAGCVRSHVQACRLAAAETAYLLDEGIVDLGKGLILERLDRIVVQDGLRVSDLRDHERACAGGSSAKRVRDSGVAGRQQRRFGESERALLPSSE